VGGIRNFTFMDLIVLAPIAGLIIVIGIYDSQSEVSQKSFQGGGTYIVHLSRYYTYLESNCYS